MSKFRLFGSHDCPHCEELRSEMEERNILFEFVDAFADDTQDLCDEHEVADLPHLQLLDADGRVILQSIHKDGHPIDLVTFLAFASTV